MKMLLISSLLPSALYCATLRIMAEFTPQSLKMAMRFGTVKTTVYKPYRLEPKRRAMNIVPTAEIMVEITSPHSRLNPPFAEILAISAALLMYPFPKLHQTCVLNKLIEVVFIAFGLGDFVTETFGNPKTCLACCCLTAITSVFILETFVIYAG